MEVIDIRSREGEIHHGDYEKMEHHEESFIWKYIFSQDHKTIAKQYLISGIFWALMGGMMNHSLLTILIMIQMSLLTLMMWPRLRRRQSKLRRMA